MPVFCFHLNKPTHGFHLNKPTQQEVSFLIFVLAFAFLQRCGSFGDLLRETRASKSKKVNIACFLF
jgi:hypothetical protein